MPVIVLRDFRRDRRAGTDDAHLAQEDVDELWQLVQTELPQELTDAGASRIVRVLDQPWIDITHLQEFFAHALGVSNHRPELIADEAAPVLANALLPEQDRTVRVQLD